MEHGTYSGYQSGCRCAECRSANAAYHKQWRDTNKSKARFSMLLQSRKTQLATQWVMRNEPELWDEFDRQARRYAEDRTI